MLPCPSLIHLSIADPCKVRRHFDVTFFQGADAVPTKPPCKPEHFSNNILSRSRLQMILVEAADVVWRHDDHRETRRAAMRLKFLDNGAPLIGLLMQYYGLQTSALDQACDFDLCRTVTTVNDKNLVVIGKSGLGGG